MKLFKLALNELSIYPFSNEVINEIRNVCNDLKDTDEIILHVFATSIDIYDAPKLGKSTPLNYGYESISIATFNVHHMKGDVTNVIKNIDILGMQEVPGKYVLDGKIKDYGFSSCFDGVYKTYGNALIYKTDNFTVLYQRTHILHDFSSKKTALEVKLSLKKDPTKTLTVFVTHLNHKNEDERLTEFQKLEKVLPNEPHIILGDFNSLKRSDYNNEEWEDIRKDREESFWEIPRTDVVERVEKLGYIDVLSVYGKPKYTCRFKTRVDYIFTFEIDVLSAKVIEEESGSDHRPVYMEIVV